MEAHLREVGRSVRRAMLDAIPDGEPHAGSTASRAPTRAGRGRRSGRPCAWRHDAEPSAAATRDVLPVAVAIELLHNAFLVHDDIADGSERRRGRPTLPAEYGLGLALNAGDALAVLANQVLRRHARRLDAGLAERVLDEFDTMALRTLEGQATELGWRRDDVDRPRRPRTTST